MRESSALKLVKPDNTKFRPPEVGKESGPKRKIIVADDHGVFAQNVADRLRAAGYEVEVVRNTDELFFKLYNGNYDMVVASNTMPMSGVQILEKIKEDPNLQNVKVVIRSKQPKLSSVETLGGIFSRVKDDNYVEQINNFFKTKEPLLVE